MDSLESPEKSKKAKKKAKKRKHSSNSDESENESSFKCLKGKHKKKCKKKHKHTKDKKHKKDKDKSKSDEEEETTIGPEIPSELLKKAQSMAPMSKDEFEKKQNTIRRVYDEETGRTRLVRGEGEIIEEIVSKERHKEINRQATQGDCQFFQSNVKKYIK